ncbi:diacylglycerol kinase [Treponema sp. TIM-1]|uniref:diacylglycerol/lipid kinase family protein n=1 Tax=Treponema sp. TIM-1 TaxID=2898417 RepID=UPI00397F65A9
MILRDFAQDLTELCFHTPLASGRPLRWTIIANPTAGGFTIRSRWKKHQTALKNAREIAGKNPRRENAGPSQTAREGDGGSGELGSLGLIPTRAPGHAGKIVKALLDEAGSQTDSSFHLLITAGGDGTSLEALIPLFEASPILRSRFAILRLPMGTGNDGADAWELAQALDLLIFPTRIEGARAVRLTTRTPGKGPFLAFNILSVGLDAFVTHMTNKMKGKLPGDSYKLWVDIASLLYDRLYRVGPMEINAFDGTGRTVKSFREPLLLLAVGVSGHRTYGSHKRILPDDRNVCGVKQMPLLRKVALKGLFTAGGHIDKPESILFTADRVEFRGEYPILAQMDGEAVLLTPEDFPGTIELTEPVIPILKRSF